MSESLIQRIANSFKGLFKIAPFGDGTSSGTPMHGTSYGSDLSYYGMMNAIGDAEDWADRAICRLRKYGYKVIQEEDIFAKARAELGDYEDYK